MNGGIYEKLAKFYDELMGDVDYDAWAEYIHGLLQKAKIPVRKVFEDVYKRQGDFLSHAQIYGGNAQTGGRRDHRSHYARP